MVRRELKYGDWSLVIVVYYTFKKTEKQTRVWTELWATASYAKEEADSLYLDFLFASVIWS